mmetsp:Transcript_2905/g.10028  ORF Transcript_2905/g.10028 Transcript_2905/m.10028 type:complete len:301 (+) Transcript_2905:103-1005(+)
MAEPPPVLYPASPDSEAKVSECAGSQFNVRVGPNYARKGNKSPSDDSMYHLSSVHMFKAESCTKHLHMATRMPLPEPLVPADSPGLPLPQLLVVTLVVPEEGPAMFGGKEDGGPSMNCVMVFQLKEKTAEDAASEAPSPAVALLSRYYGMSIAIASGGSPTGAEKSEIQKMRACFKLIGQASNFSDLGLPAMLAGYNGKPVIINKTGELHQGKSSSGASYMEMDILVHKWQYIARKGLYSIKEHYCTLDAEVGFVIQGEADSELPERMLGAVEINGVDPTLLAKWPSSGDGDGDATGSGT